MKAINEEISVMIKKLRDKSDKKTEEQLQPISVKITEISSKHSENIQNKTLTLNSEDPSSEYNFKRNFQENFSPYN